MHRRTRLGLTAAAVATLALAGGLRGSADPQGAASLISSHNLRMNDERFGGYSAIEVLDAGQRFIALSDRGTWLTGRFLRDTEGVITALEMDPVLPLLATGDAPLKKNRSDSEGLAVAADGTIYVSFEGAARVLSYDSPKSSAQNLPLHPDFRDMPRNAALEALAIDAQGRLYTLPENTRSGKGDFPLYVYANGAWSQPFYIPRQNEFLPVGADFGPDGRLYLLERAFYGLGGFASRIRAFELAEDHIISSEVILETRAGRHDNVEGISVWQAPQGETRITLISDDNHKFYLRNQIIEYRLTARSPENASP